MENMYIYIYRHVKQWKDQLILRREAIQFVNCYGKTLEKGRKQQFITWGISWLIFAG